MLSVAALRNTIRHYEWGSRTALAELCGRPSPAPEPEAELWIGAHPGAPSSALVDGAWQPLPDLISAAADNVLGSDVAARFGAELPFLLKLLAADRPLSLQAHPNRSQAETGFAREEAAGIPRDSPERSYRDPHAKPELICALTRFEALLGFRSLDDICATLTEAGEGVAGLLELAVQPEPAIALRGLFEAWLGLSEQQLARIVAWAADASEPVLREVPALAGRHPRDPGALAPLFLNRITLEPGEALYLPAGRLHAYLDGLAVEVMACSDNVLRCGLTTKHVDRRELSSVLRFEETPRQVLTPFPVDPGEGFYATPAEEFVLSVLDLPAADGERRIDSVEVLLATDGEIRVEASGIPALSLQPGDACLVPASTGAYSVRGSGRLFRVRVPGPVKKRGWSY